MAGGAGLVLRDAGVVADMIVLHVFNAQYRYSFPISVNQYPVSGIQRLIVELPMYF